MELPTTAIPVTDFGFNPHKQAFHDALCLRYGWPLSRLPCHCVCGIPFSIDHAHTCPKGAFPIIRYNRIRDLLADLLTEVCPCVVENCLYSSPSVRNNFNFAPPMLRTRQDSIFLHKNSGTREGQLLFLMSRCSMPMLPLTAPPQLPHAIVGMNWRKARSMREE